MPRPTSSLPTHLTETFSAQDVALAGVHSRRLHKPDVTRISFGVYQRTDPAQAVTTEDPDEETTSFAKRKEAWEKHQLARATTLSRYLPAHHFYSLRTAALLWQLPTFRNLDPDLDIACFRPTRPLRREGFNAMNVEPRLASAAVLPGTEVRLTDPASTWAMHAAHLPLPDIIALGDAVIRQHRVPGTNRLAKPPLATLADLERVTRSGRRLGIDRLRQALPQLSISSASVPETHLRLEIQQWELPPHQLDYDVYDNSNRLLGCSEVAFPEFKLALEYEGDHHRTKTKQWNRDIQKYHAYTQADWEVIRVTGSLLYRTPWLLRSQILEALHRRGWRA